MTEDEHAMLAYLVGKQAQMDALLTAAIPLILRACASDDKESKDFRDAVIKALSATSKPLLDQEAQFIDEQFPRDSKVIRQMVSLPARQNMKDLGGL